MVSEKFMINSDDGRLRDAKAAAERFAEGAGMKPRNALRFDLLVEESLGMVKTMVDDYFGQMWFAGDDKGCEIHMELMSDMTGDKREELLSVSRSGQNALAKGFMARVGDFLSRSAHSFGKALDVYGAQTMRYGIVGGGGVDTPTVYDVTPMWSLQQYRAGLESDRARDKDASAAWDELEKSIVANLADDVVVGVKGDRAELVIVKRFDN
ncbi:MAG: hypothetical protein IJ646_04380 [Clostridia bacterium]|nr:hypothetical protein [Clostridia bacterium]